MTEQQIRERFDILDTGNVAAAVCACPMKIQLILCHYASIKHYAALVTVGIGIAQECEEPISDYAIGAMHIINESVLKDVREGYIQDAIRSQ